MNVSFTFNTTGPEKESSQNRAGGDFQGEGAPQKVVDYGK